MDSLITAAGRALATGDPLGALNRVALRSDPAALAVRGIAMAQLGDLPRARALLHEAGRGFGHREAASRARCVVAQAEIALAMRDLNWAPASLDAACVTLERVGDHLNVAQAQLLEVRRQLLLGHLDDAQRRADRIQPTSLSPALRATHALVRAGIAIRRLHAAEASTAIDQARAAAAASGIVSLRSEVEQAAQLLQVPAARITTGGTERLLRLAEVERVAQSRVLIVDALRRQVSRGATTIALATRPVLFALARTLAEAWPTDVARDVLLLRAFDAKFVDESHRARLRVEIARLRRAIVTVATISATSRGFAIAANDGVDVVVLSWPFDEEHAAILSLLADGEAWPTSALALATGTSQRTVQRAIDSLKAASKVHAFGRGRSRRWMRTNVPGFTTPLLLPAELAPG